LSDKNEKKKCNAPTIKINNNPLPILSEKAIYIPEITEVTWISELIINIHFPNLYLIGAIYDIDLPLHPVTWPESISVTVMPDWAVDVIMAGASHCRDDANSIGVRYATGAPAPVANRCSQIDK
jgi:hypothetical protein